MEIKKVLITGSSGYIGAQMVNHFIRLGYEITGLDTDFYNGGTLYNSLLKPSHFIQKDIRDVALEDLAGIDAVIHLAELSNDPIGQLNPEITRDINHKGTVRLADLAKTAGVGRFIYSSSCSVYGASDEFSNEESMTNPLTEYARCKLLNEQYLLKIADEKFAPVIMRNATVFGASPQMRFDLVVNNLSGLAWTEKELKLESNGTPWRPLVHILDVCGAFSAAVSAPKDKVSGQILNVGSNGTNYQVKDIAGIIGEVFKVDKVSFNMESQDKRNYKVNFDKIGKVLPEFKARYTIKDGAEELKEIFKEINMTSEIFLSKNFTRLKMINHHLERGDLDANLRWKKQ
jgi:nucleoside-diphosphate-sugar epimerase